MFDRVVCINLDRRPDRWQRFQAGIPAGWPFAPIERVAAVDGYRVPIPSWYGRPPAKLNHARPKNWRRQCSPGAWGCLRTHLRIWEDALTAGHQAVLVLEDDAVFIPEFVERCLEFLAAVPDDWEQIYLGGQHLGTDKRPPVRVNSLVARGWNVNRTHAYVMRSSMMQTAYQVFASPWEGSRPQDYHVDHSLGRLHPNHCVYTPHRWLVGQAGGTSDIRGRLASTAWWNEFPVVEEPALC